MEECTANVMEECTVHAEGWNLIEFGIVSPKYARRPRIALCVPHKNVHCCKLIFLMNLSKIPQIPRLNFPWTIF
jgi:hypothetical protein